MYFSITIRISFHCQLRFYCYL